MKKDFQSTLALIKTRGYWKIHIFPTTTESHVINPINKGKEIIRESAVQFRGWDYPHFPTNNQENQNAYIADDRVEAWIDFEQYKEVWRLYDSGQFVHFFSIREDWWGEDSWLTPDHYLKKIQPGAVLEAISTVYSLTEIYAFIRNLVQAKLFENEVSVEISLVGTKDRELYVSDPARAPLFWHYKAATDRVDLLKKIYKIQDIESNYLDLAFEQIVYLFNQFNWDNPPLQVIKEDQKKLIERRL